MALTIDDILDKKFIEGKGYDADDVDQFLDQIIDEMTTREEETANLKAKLEQALQDLDAAKAMAKTASVQAPVTVATAPVQDSSVHNTASALEGILARAQKLADAEVEEAKEKAESIVEEAKQQASRLVTDAKAEQSDLMEKLDELRANVSDAKKGMLNMLDKFRDMVQNDTTKF